VVQDYKEVQVLKGLQDRSQVRREIKVQQDQQVHKVLQEELLALRVLRVLKGYKVLKVL
jgi:hypothetical protein